MVELQVPPHSLVVLVGPSGSGKSTFARRHFAVTEVVSSDQCRALVADDENDQSATAAAFAVLHAIVAGRLRQERLAVVDATSVSAHARRPLLGLARAHDVTAIAVVFDLPVEVCVERTGARTDRDIAVPVVVRQHEQLRASHHQLRAEGFGSVITLSSVDEVDAARVTRG